MVNKYKHMSMVNNINGCRHCGGKEPAYCEKCYQDVITQNAAVQIENANLINELNSYKFNQKYNPYQPIITKYTDEQIEDFKKYAEAIQERADEINTGKVR